MVTEEDLNFRSFIRAEGIGALSRAIMRAVQEAGRHQAVGGELQLTPALDETFVRHLPAALEKEQLELFFNIDGSKIKIPDLAEEFHLAEDHAEGWLKTV